MNTLYILVPESLLDDANHMEYCFESCYPSSPLFSLNMQDEAGNKFAVSSPFVSDNFILGLTSYMQSGQLPEPEWNTEQFNEAGESAGYLADMDKANKALANTVIYEDEMVIPAGKIVMAINARPDFGLSQIL